MVGGNISAIKRNKEAKLKDDSEVGLEVQARKIKYTVMSRHQNVEQNHHLLIANKLFENVPKFKYFK